MVVTARTWSSRPCHNRILGFGHIRDGNTKRIGDVAVDIETSSIMRPWWITRKSIGPVCVEWKTDAKEACSDGGSESPGGGGRGALRREVGTETVIACEGE